MFLALALRGNHSHLTALSQFVVHLGQYILVISVEEMELEVACSVCLFSECDVLT